MSKLQSILRSIWKSVRALLILAIPFVLTNFPEFTNVTIGAVLLMIYDQLKHRTRIALP